MVDLAYAFVYRASKIEVYKSPNEVYNVEIPILSKFD